MKKILSLLLLLTLIAGLFACGKNDDGVPEGMQLVCGGSDVGYYMYAPEEWTVSNHGSISAAYASKVDNSTITYTETEMPKMSFAEYFNESAKSYTEDMKFKLLTSKDGVATTFGNADEAIMFEFEFEYLKYTHRSLQILAKYKERFGIFTFTSYTTNLSSPDESQYDYYKEKIDTVIAEFKYVEKNGKSEAPSYEIVDGYKLISDSSVAKFNFYVPENYTPSYSSGIVSAYMDDGSSVNISRPKQTNVRIDEYLNNRIEELKSIVFDVTVIPHVNSDGTTENYNLNAELGNAKDAASHEYTYVYNGVKYHVYQVCAVTRNDGFVFTYTATEENYYKHIDTVYEIAKRINFK